MRGEFGDGGVRGTIQRYPTRCLRFGGAGGTLQGCSARCAAIPGGAGGTLRRLSTRSVPCSDKSLTEVKPNTDSSPSGERPIQFGVLLGGCGEAIRSTESATYEAFIAQITHSDQNWHNSALFPAWHHRTYLERGKCHNVSVYFSAQPPGASPSIHGSTNDPGSRASSISPSGKLQVKSDRPKSARKCSISGMSS